MNAFFIGLMLGFGAAIPIGPVNILIMSNALIAFRFGIAIGLGAVSIDILYIILLNLGILKLLNQPLFLDILYTFSIIFLSYIGYLTFKTAKNFTTENKNNVKIDSFLKCYIRGALLNLVNPYIIAFWLSAASFIVSNGDMALNVSGLIFAIGCWVFGLSFIVSKSKRFISQNIAKWFAYSSSFLMFGFAIMLIYNRFF